MPTHVKSNPDQIKPWFFALPIVLLLSDCVLVHLKCFQSASKSSEAPVACMHAGNSVSLYASVLAHILQHGRKNVFSDRH